VATKKISQLDGIDDANLSGEAILPVVVSDPLIPNRKSKVNQLFKTVSAGTKAAPGLCFDLDRDTGLYQNAYNQFGISYGSGGFYFSRIENTDGSSTNLITVADDSATNSNIIISPKGAGRVEVTGQLLLNDNLFVLQDNSDNTRKARFEVGNIGNTGGTRVFTLPEIVTGGGTVLLGDDTNQLITNKDIIIEDQRFTIRDGVGNNEKNARFTFDWDETITGTKTYQLPDPGIAVVTSELVDDVSTQKLSGKTLIDAKFASTTATDAPAITFDTASLTSDRTVVFPDLSLTLVGTDSTQSLSNKVIEDLILADGTTPTKRIIFNLTNQFESLNYQFQFPSENLNEPLNPSVLVTTNASQKLSNKELNRVDLVDDIDEQRRVRIDLTNITQLRNIKFPDSDATLLSTNNVALEDVQFGAGIGAQKLTARVRQQQLYLSQIF
jgi:hypothetical protein